MQDTDGSGHLTADDIEKYFSQPFAATRRLSATPRTYLYIDPSNQQLRLRGPFDPRSPDLILFDRIQFSNVQEPGGGHTWSELTVNSAGAHYEAYLIIAAIVDLIVSGETFSVAVSSSLDSLKMLLQRTYRLSEEQQIGLLGEMLLLRHLTKGPLKTGAVSTWVASNFEEHDFSFDAFSVEVKTTRSENRVHSITSATQLRASPGRPLYLLSIQITASGAALGGKTLNDVITETRAQLSGDSRADLDGKLHKSGWRDEDSSLYASRWSLRSIPRLFSVDKSFPALTPDRIAEVVPSAHHVIGVQYRLNLSTMPQAAFIPEPMTAFCQEASID